MRLVLSFRLCCVLLLFLGVAPCALSAAWAAEKAPSAESIAKDAAYTNILDMCNDGVRAHEDGRFDEAVRLYTKVIDSGRLPDGDNLLAYILHNRGLIMLQRGKAKQAMKDLDQAVAHLKDKQLLVTKGRAWMAMGDDQKAVDDFTQAIALDPEYEKAFYYRGLAFAALGNAKRAREDLYKAKRYFPHLQFQE